MSALTAAALIVAAAGTTTETSLTPERPDLAVVNSLGPVLPNETVAAFVPNFAGAVSPVTVRILDGGEPTAAAVDRPVLRQAAGVVHWLNSNTELDQLNYTLCVDGACGPPTKLNAAELWWHQCVGSSRSVAQPNNGLVCAAGGVLRIFGRALAFERGHCAPYKPYVYGTAATHAKVDAPPVRLRLAAHGGAPIELIATTQSCYDATFALPASLGAGNYTLMVKANLPSSTWELARDPDQHFLTVVVPAACNAAGNIVTATSAAELHKALVTSRARQGGATVLVEGTITLSEKDGPLVLPQCTVLKGSDSTSKLLFSSTSCSNAGGFVPLIGPDPASDGSATVEDLAIEIPALDGVGPGGCNALLGALNGSGFTLRNLNVTGLKEQRQSNPYTALISMVKNTHFLIEGCTFLHLGGAVPIFSTLMASEGIIRNNLWQVGCQGTHMDRCANPSTRFQESIECLNGRFQQRQDMPDYRLAWTRPCVVVSGPSTSSRRAMYTRDISTTTRHARSQTTRVVTRSCLTVRVLSLVLVASSSRTRRKTSRRPSGRVSHSMVSPPATTVAWSLWMAPRLL